MGDGLSEFVTAADVGANTTQGSVVPPAIVTNSGEFVSHASLLVRGCPNLEKFGS